MSAFGGSIDHLAQERRELQRRWNDAGSMWSDQQRDRLERTTVEPLVRGATVTVRELQAIASQVQQALSTL